MRQLSLATLTLFATTVIAQGSICDQFQAAMSWNGNGGSAATFFGTSNPPADGYIWYFGDGTEANGPAATHTYAQGGSYEVCMSAWLWDDVNQDTCWTEACQVILISDPCDVLEACFFPSDMGNGAFLFGNCSSIQNNVQFVWTFGDGASGNMMHAEHQYTQPGTYTVCLTTYWQNCEDSICTQITVPSVAECGAYNADFTWLSNVGTTVQFVGTTDMPADGVVWDLGDGSEGFGLQPTHTYASTGTYEVCIAAWYWNEQLQDTCWTETCQFINVFNVGPCQFLDACYVPSQNGPSTFFFNNCTANEPGTTYYWDFGDGNGSSIVAPTHTFTDPGAYNVCLYSFWQNCVDSTCTVITIGGADPCLGLNAGFTHTTTPNGTLFSNGTSGTGFQTQFLWHFGDGTTSTAAQPFHIYAQDGTYTACLEVVSVYQVEGGNMVTCVDSTCSTVTIGEGNPCDDLNAGFSGSPVGLNVNFANDVIDFTWTYLWSFGDGTEGNGPNAYHTYIVPGTYQVCLVVSTWDPIAQVTCFEDHCETITVIGNEPCDALEACFVPSPTGPSSFFFNNCTANEPGTQFIWNFGDGTSGTGVAPTHTYAQPGNYTVCLTAFWQNCSDSTCTTITVGNFDPCVGLNAAFTHTTTPNGTLFSNGTTGTGFQTQFLWNFGDGTTSTNAQPNHLYTSDGVYEVCLEVLSMYQVDGGVITCVDSTCATVTIGAGDPCVDFEACLLVNEPVNGVYLFENCSSHIQGTQFYWEFGDGFGSSNVIAEHGYSQPGTYTVCLFAYYQNCADSTCTTVTVPGEDPCEGLSAGFTHFTTPNGTQFSNATTGTGFQTQFFWDFGDGTTSNDAQPFHTYAQDGFYAVCLQAISIFQIDGGMITCLDTTCTLITIGAGDPCDMLVACFEPLPFENGVYFFENCSEILPIDIPEYYFWDFGDGSSSNEAEPDHSFLPGTYTVCLMVEHGDCVDTTCTTITVSGENPCDALDAGFIASGGLGMNFANDVIDFSWTYHWDFGDGSDGFGPSPYHIYPASGTYEVCLTVYTWDPIAQDTCFESHCELITAFDGVGCDPNFACEFTWDAQSTAVVFFGTGNHDTDGMVWDLGDGTTGYGNVYTHLYEPPGPFEVCLNAWYWNESTQDSCWTSTCMLVDPFNVINGVGDVAFADVNVFPNPAQDRISISGLPGGGELRLFAPDGRVVLTERTSADLHQMSVGHLATGVYVLQVRVDGGLFVQRLSIE